MSLDDRLFTVILAGGSGTRFWPASRRLSPKQLLPLGPAAPLSLLRRTVDRLSGLVALENVRIATGRHLVEGTRADLPELAADAFLAEPEAKNTAPCIGWAAALVAARDPEAVVAVLPSDQFATDPAGFQRTLAEAARVARSGHITTIGIVPTRPETGYGYIELGDAAAEGGRVVSRFVEKPAREVAEEYVASGRYLWNAGMFVFRASDMLAAFDAHLPEMATRVRALAASFGSPSYDSDVEQFFRDVASVSIDYGIMEKSKDLRVVPGDFGWSDLGSWESAWELSTHDDAGNAAPPSAVLVDARGNLIQQIGTHTKKTIALVGVDDLCVVETDDALLILPRERSQDVRAVVDALKRRGDADLT